LELVLDERTQKLTVEPLPTEKRRTTDKKP